MTYEEQRYIDSEYPADLSAKLRAADIALTDPLPAWAIRELESNLYSDLPSLAHGEVLADRNAHAYSTFRAVWMEARDMKRAAFDTRPRGDDLKARCARAASDAIYDLCTDVMDAAVKTYVETISKGAKP